MSGTDQLLQGDIYDSRKGLPIDERQVRAAFADKQVECALKLGREYIEKQIVMFGALNEDFPGEFTSHVQRLVVGLAEQTMAANRPSHVEHICGDKYVMQSGSRQVQVGMSKELGSAEVVRLVKALE